MWFTMEYLPTFENDEQERIDIIKKHLENNDFDYLYEEFDFDDNEFIVNGYFDNNNQLHIYYMCEEGD